jgi:hypothetical protein
MASTALQPPRRGVADRAGTLQGQLRALAARVLQLEVEASNGTATAGSGAGGAGFGSGRRRNLERSEGSDAATVSRLSRRALEVLLRQDKDVTVTKFSAAERTESNSLKLGAILFAVRRRGDAAAADLVEGLADAFAARDTAFLPATPLQPGAGLLPQLPDVDQTLADAESGRPSHPTPLISARRAEKDAPGFNNEAPQEASRLSPWPYCLFALQFQFL